MTGIEALTAIGAATGTAGVAPLPLASAPLQPGQASFGDMLADGLRQVDTKVTEANDLVRRFAVDETVPLHHVTFALEEARLAVELAMQVRTRVVESYRELMNMQL